MVARLLREFVLPGFVLLGLAGVASAAPPPDVDLVPRSTAPESVVTARRWVEDPLTVPQSITVLPESLVRDLGIRDIRDAAFRVPNLNLVEFSARRLSFPFVRGIGSGQGDPAVTTYVDDVPIVFAGGSNSPLLDVSKIEFLRGPQATLFGRNALGGVIHVSTRRPPPEPELRVEGIAGSHGLIDLRLIAGAPIVENRLTANVAGLLNRRDGYTLNTWTGRRVDDRETWFGRAQVFWTPDERNELRLRLSGERTRDGGFVLSDLFGLRRRPHRIHQDFSGVTERDMILPSLTWRHAGDSVLLTSIVSFESWDILETSDFDFSALDGVRRRTEEDFRALLTEIRASSAPDAPIDVAPEAKLRWLAGLLWFQADSGRSAANEFRPGGVGIVTEIPGTDRSRGDFENRGLGLFGQATITLFEDVSLGAGLRYDVEWRKASLRRTFVSGGTTLSSRAARKDEDDGEILPRFDLSFRVTPEITAYCLAARSFKAGGFNLDAPSGQLAYAAETSWTYEAGLKLSLFEGRVRVDAAWYFVDWEDMQLSRFDAQAGGYVTNAGESTSQGLEVQVSARPIEGLDLFAGLGTARTRFDSFVDQYGVDARGNRLPFAPRTTFGAGARMTGELADGVEYLLSAEYGAVGSFYYDAGNRESERYALANFRVGLHGESWGVHAFVRNAFDAEYVPVAFQPDPTDPRTFVGESGAPRTFGFSLNLEF